MGIVKDYKIGNTSIKIADDYCLSKTDEEVEDLQKLKETENE